MQTKKRIQICQNHLADLYEALKRGDVREVQKVEHLLTPAEECVACAYIFKTSGTVREALEDFLEKEGFEVDSQKNKTELRYWILKIVVFFGIFFILFVILGVVKKIVFSLQGNLLTLNIMELSILFIATTLVFVVIGEFF